MSSTLSNVVSSPTEADDQSPLVVEPLVVIVNNSSSSNTHIDSSNQDVVCLKSTVSSGPRALGGYSLSLLSNSNLAPQAGVVSTQPDALVGTKRLRSHSFPPSIPKRRRKPSCSTPLVSLDLNSPVTSSSVPIILTSRSSVSSSAPAPRALRLVAADSTSNDARGAGVVDPPPSGLPRYVTSATFLLQPANSSDSLVSEAPGLPSPFFGDCPLNGGAADLVFLLPSAGPPGSRSTPHVLVSSSSSSLEDCGNTTPTRGSRHHGSRPTTSLPHHIDTTRV